MFSEYHRVLVLSKLFKGFHNLAASSSFLITKRVCTTTYIISNQDGTEFSELSISRSWQMESCKDQY